MFLQIVQSQAYMLVQLVIQCLYNGKNWRVTNIVWYNLMRLFRLFQCTKGCGAWQRALDTSCQAVCVSIN